MKRLSSLEFINNIGVGNVVGIRVQNGAMYAICWYRGYGVIVEANKPILLSKQLVFGNTPMKAVEYTPECTSNLSATAMQVDNRALAMLKLMRTSRTRLLANGSKEYNILMMSDFEWYCMQDILADGDYVIITE